MEREACGAIQPSFSERRGDRYLLVWPGLPHWMVVDGEVLAALQLLDGSRSVASAVEELSRRTGRSAVEVNGSMEALLARLKRSGIVPGKRAVKERGGGRPAIENVTINVTRRCNLRCRMCYNDPAPSGEELGMAEMVRFIGQARPLCSRTPTLALLGGEPLLEPEKTVQLLRAGKRFGFDGIVSTNGTLVTREIATLLADTGAAVQVSLDGAVPGQNDFLRGAGTFGKALDGIRLLKQEGAHVVLSMVCHRGNFGSLEQYYDLALELRADEARFIPLKRVGGAVANGIEPVPNDEMVLAMRALLRRRPDLGRLLGRDYFTILGNICRLSNRRRSCGTGSRTLLLDSDGSVYPCPNHVFPEFRAGNIRDAPFRRIWLESPVLLRLRQEYDIERLNEKCSGCVVRHWCMGGCRGEAYYNARSPRSPAAACGHIRKAILEMFWILSEGPDLVRTDRDLAD